MTLVYFAHPVDYATVEHDALYKLAEEALISNGGVVFRPMEAYNHDGKARSGLQAGNAAILTQAAPCMFAVWPRDQISVGVPIEMFMALTSHTRVALVTDFVNSWTLEWLVDISQNHMQIFPLNQIEEAAKWLIGR